jgi:hypothetical protein
MFYHILFPSFIPYNILHNMKFYFKKSLTKINSCIEILISSHNICGEDEKYSQHNINVTK